jgi:TolB-like protein/DNA-binding winged helix-turn-helix (wHTH) protein
MAADDAEKVINIRDLVVDAGARRVTRGDQEIALPKLSFDLLFALARAAPDTLSIDDLMDQVWGKAVVSPATVAKRVELLRHALGDDSADPRYIALVRGHGYRLITDGGAAAPSPASGRRWIIAAVAATVIAAVVVGIMRMSGSGRPAPEKSVAVLPFVAMSRDEDVEIFADGLTEEVSHALANIAELKVTGRTSSFHYKNRNEDLREIGATLGVAHLLEGSVRRSDDRIRVTAQLIDAEDGFHLWSKVYDSTPADTLRIQEDIAHNVADALRVTFSLEQEKALVAHGDIDPDSYLLYLRAQTLASRAGPSTPERDEVQSLLETVLERHPDYVPALLWLAKLEAARLRFHDESYEVPWDEGWSRVARNAERVIELEPGNAEAYAVLSTVAWHHRRDPVEANRHISQALALGPTNLYVLKVATSGARALGRFDLALELDRSLVARDPLCVGCRIWLTKSYEQLGRLEEAEQTIRETQTLMGNSGGEWTLGTILLQRGRPAAALESFSPLDHHLYLRLAGRAMALHDLGRHEESAAEIAALEAEWATEQPIIIAQVYAYIGQPDLAFDWIGRDLEGRADFARGDYLDTLFANLHNDPRWLPLLEQIGRSPKQLARVPFEVPVPPTAN